MLAEVLRSVQRFERTDGFAPNVVYLNAAHWLALMRECPGLRGGDPHTPFGFHVLVLPSEDLPHPRSARIPLARAPAKAGRGDRLRPTSPSAGVA